MPLRLIRYWRYTLHKMMPRLRHAYLHYAAAPPLYDMIHPLLTATLRLFTLLLMIR